MEATIWGVYVLGKGNANGSYHLGAHGMKNLMEATM